MSRRKGPEQRRIGDHRRIESVASQRKLICKRGFFGAIQIAGTPHCDAESFRQKDVIEIELR